MEQNFENMVQVLGYLADQCDLFKPMVDGVTSLQEENTQLKSKVRAASITNNRLQLNSTFSADYANFGITTVKTASTGTESENNLKISQQNDLYNLIRGVILVGKENYSKSDMEYKLDFFSMVEKITFDQYSSLIEIIDKQHTIEGFVPPPLDSDDIFS